MNEGYGDNLIVQQQVFTYNFSQSFLFTPPKSRGLYYSGQLQDYKSL